MLSTGRLLYDTTEQEPEQVLTNSERDNILNSLFLNKGEVDSSFLYKWKWAELYEKISKDKSYPFIDIEVSCLKNLKYDQSFKKILEKTKVITDVWSWDWQKAVALLKWTSWEWTYIPEDYSHEMLKIAEGKIKKELPDVKLWSSQKLNNGKHLSQQYQNNMYLFLGWTICNMSDEDIITELKDMDNNWIINWNKILLSYFTAPNTQEEIDDLIKIYNSENNKAFHENGMDMLWLSKDDFEYDTVYEKDNPDQNKWPFPWRIKWVIRAKRDTTVKLSDWYEIEVQKWKEFTIHYSRRFSKEWIEKLFKKSGCNVVFTVDNTGDAITLLQRKPRKMWAIKKMVNKTLIWALIMGSLVGYGIKSKQVEKANEKNKAYTEWESKTKAKTTSEWMYYYQETYELISALQLDKLENEENKQATIDLFNKYIWDHKADWVTNIELIQWFWKEYGWILVKDFWVFHSPYDFMTSELINLTSNINEELTYTPNVTLKNEVLSQRHYTDYGMFESIDRYRPFEYNDWWKKYLISKVKIQNWNTIEWVYFVQKELEWWHLKTYSEPSTSMINEINNKSWLDNEIVSNTINLKENYIAKGDVFNIHPLHIRNVNKDQIVKMSQLSDVRIPVNTVYLNWKFYYVITVQTESWKNIWLASNTISWEYTTTTFSELAKDFKYARTLD